MPQDPRRVACWRFEIISPLLDERFTAAERRRQMRSIARVTVQWPSGRYGRIATRTLARWLATFQKTRQLESLQPAARRPGKPRCTLREGMLLFALAFFEQDPDRSLYLCAKHLALKFNLARPPASATLHRALRNEPRYLALRKRARGQVRLRVRFQAAKPHELWHADAKSKFPYVFTTGIRMKLIILTILDDASRYPVASRLWPRENEAAAVGTFRDAAAEWGLPESFYADRGSCYDAEAFRQGLALLGIRRIETRARNPQAHGKLEAYNRILQRWFIDELRHQLAHDLAQLQEMLDAVTHLLYLPHRHREIGTSPQAALAGRRSERQVSLERLKEVFLGERRCVVCPRTGTIRLGRESFSVPPELSHKKKIVVLQDPEYPVSPYLRDNHGALVPLKRALTRRPEPASPPTSTPAREAPPPGALTPLVEHYRGRLLPKAYPGFGLPEIYAAFSQALGRQVPVDETEASSFVEFLKAGPFRPQAFLAALEVTLRELGPGRPLRSILAQLKKRIVPPPASKERRS